MVLEGVSKREVLVLAREVAALAGEVEEVGRVHDVLLVFVVHLADAGLVGVARDGVVGDAHRYPHRTFLGSLADHLHHPELVFVGDRERFARRGVAVVLHEIGHYLDRLAGGLRPFERDLDQRAVVDDAVACRILKFLVASPGRFTDTHLVLVHVTDHVICVGRLGNLAEGLAGVPVHDFAHRPFRVVGRRGVGQHAVEVV